MFVKKSLRVSLISALPMLAMCLSSALAHASTVGVGGCTNFVNFTTISQAISAVPPGSTIMVCPGNYYEQLLITKKLTLEGVVSGNENAAIIYPPAAGLISNTTDARGAVAAQILVQGTAGPVKITNLTVDGTGNNYTSGDLRGILYQDASGTVLHVAARNQIPGGTLNGDQSGQGIMVETTSSSSAVLTVENSSVHNYNKNGIVARYTGASLTATGNFVQGAGAVSGSAAQNGIEIAFNGATGSIKSNTVLDNVYYDPSSASSAGILLYDTKQDGGIPVSGNTVGNSQEGIQIFTDSPGALGDVVNVTANKIYGTSSFDAIDVCTSGNTITGNTIINAAQSGVHFDGSCGVGNSNSASANTFIESACAGYLVDTDTSNPAPTGTYLDVPFEVATTTASCTIPQAQQAHGRTGSKIRP
jgi:hypothetical protein